MRIVTKSIFEIEYDNLREQDILNIGVINQAIKEALSSDYRFKLGAVVFKGSRIISAGHNSIRYCSYAPQQYRKWDNSLHAELASILKVKDKDNLVGASLFVLKISNKIHNISNAKPCDYCMSAIEFSRIKNVYFTNSEGLIEHIHL